jgi:ubiquinone/menaquinone biosynthesis C-methylase UbiE
MSRPDSPSRWTDEQTLKYEWLDEQDRMDRLLRPLGARMLEAATLKPGEHVLDIGCGTGYTTIAAWQAVQPEGTVTGLDISPPMIEKARARATAAAVPVGFLVTDVQTHPFPRNAANVAISRFGVGHFANTVAGFTNIATAIRPGGRLVFTEWAPGETNEWMTLVDDIARRVWPHRSPAATSPVHGPDFDAYASLSKTIARAGLNLDSLELAAADLPIGRDVADVLRWFETLPERHILDDVSPQERTSFIQELIRELRARSRPDGVYVRGTAWVAVSTKASH